MGIIVNKKINQPWRPCSPACPPESDSLLEAGGESDSGGQAGEHGCQGWLIFLLTMMPIWLSINFKMNLLDFYKHITETIPNYLMFVVFSVIVVFAINVVISFATEQIIKIVLAIRAPINSAVTINKDQE